MKHILGLTNCPQRKDQDILEAVELGKSVKKDLNKYRLEGFGSLLKKISAFCEKYEIPMVNMNETYANPKGRRQRLNVTNQHYYEFDCFNTIVDMQIREFGEIVRLSEFYPNDFDSVERKHLEDQLNLYYANVSKDDRFANLNGIADLAKEMVKTRKHLSYHLVYRLLKLALVLPVATTTVESCFSAMKLVKSDLRNYIGDEFLTLVSFVP
uniref:uncharacterized protein LOC122601541 n=1 Tax=Erigeron canadensis TaxID=72917 RepID=UPI001CB9A28D|nr:uncharacterized protein LOC122601541 [Erigeron canadensis]